MPTSMNQYGDPLLTRTSEISTKVAKSEVSFPLQVMGKYQSIKQIRVRIGLPVYRLSNGRTRTFQREYLATHPDAAPDLFTKDHDALEAQRAQHEILQRLAEDEDLLKEFQSGTQQTDPIIVTNTGVVVNGNRRLCVWRTLLEKDPEKYKHFKFIDIAVLPNDCDEEAIKVLEKDLQIKKTHRAEYKWHTKATMLKEERETGVSTDKLATSYDMSKKDVDTLIGALEYADIYLQKIGKPDQWSIVDGDEFAFKTMVEERKKITDQGRKELFETACFRLIEKKDYQGRLYSIIPDIAKNLDKLLVIQEKDILQQAEQPEKSESNGRTAKGKNDAGNSSESDDGEDIDLLGGGSTPKDKYSELASAIRKSDIKLGEIIKQIIDEQKSLKNEQKNAKYLINTLSSVSRSLLAICNSGLNENTITKGANTQIESIEEYLRQIKKWLEEH